MPPSPCFDAEPFDAVVVDLDLPPLDGWCVLARWPVARNTLVSSPWFAIPGIAPGAERLGAELVYETVGREPIGAARR